MRNLAGEAAALLPLLCDVTSSDGTLPAGGARVQDAAAPVLPRPALRHHARVLAQGSRQAAHLRDSAVETGGLLHNVRLGVQGGGIFFRPPVITETLVAGSLGLLTLIEPRASAGPRW